MKRIVIVLFTLILSVPLFSQDFLQRHSEQLASGILRTASSNGIKLQGKRLSILPFSLVNNANDSVYNKYSVELVQQLSLALQNEAQRQGINLTVLPTDTVLLNQIIRQGQMQSLRPDRYLQKVKIYTQPDFYVKGTFDLDMQNYKFVTKNVVLVRNTPMAPAQWSLPDITTDLTLNDRNSIIEGNTFTSPMDIASDLRFCIANQANKVVNLQVYPLEYEQTGATTEFSAKMNDLVMQQLSILPELNLRSAMVATRGIFDQFKRYKLTGNYYVENDRLRITFRLTSPSGKRTYFTQTYYLPVKNLTTNYLPPNVQVVTTVSTELDKEPEKNDFSADITTNKGNENPTFYEGETVTFYIYSEKQVYIRIIDILSDGRKALLMPTYQIPIDSVGKYFLLGTSTAVPPFGTEYIVLQAMTEPFAPLRTHMEGQLTIIDGSIGQTRAMTPIKVGNIPNVLKAEKIITVTTLPKKNKNKT